MCDQLSTMYFRNKELAKGWKGGAGGALKGLLQRFPMNIWQNKFRVLPPMRNHWIIWWELLPQHKALHWAVEGQRETKMQVGQTAALYLSLSLFLTLRLSLSLLLSLLRDKERQRCKLGKRRLWRFSRRSKESFWVTVHSDIFSITYRTSRFPLAFLPVECPI